MTAAALAPRLSQLPSVTLSSPHAEKSQPTARCDKSAAVYAIRNLSTGAVYVGSTRDAHTRWRVQRGSLRRGRHWITALQAAWNVDGEAAFVFELLQEMGPQTTLAALNAAERRWHERLAADGTMLYNPQFQPRSDAPKLTKAPRQSRDAPILAELLELHTVANPRILDATYGHGNIWGHLPIRHQVIKVDINQDLEGLDLVADWRDLPPHYPPGSIDCLVWDPIHVADVGLTSKRYSRYVAPQNPVKGESVNHLFPAFFDVAEQLLKPRTGIVLAKMCDQVHAGVRQWQCDVLRAVASGRGWTACDRKMVQKPPAGRDPKHKVKYHAGEQLAEWIVLRNGPACHGPGRRLKHELNCTVCGAKFSARRSDARTCPGGRCRQRRHRQHPETVQP